MNNLSGYIVRLGGGRVFRLMALLALSVSLVASQPDQSAVAHSVDLRQAIKGWEHEADFTRSQAMQLNKADRALYARIFALQEQGAWDEADTLIAYVHDPLLVGHVLYQRYLVNAAYKSQFSELNSWLKDFGDHPFADRVYQLAQRRRGQDDVDVYQPVLLTEQKPAMLIQASASADSWHHLEDYVQKRLPQMMADTNAKAGKQSKEQVAAANILARQIRKELVNDRVAQALELFNTSDVTIKLTAPQQGVLLTQIAFGYYYDGKHGRARLIAQRARRLKGQHQLIADWVSGLSSWQLQEYAPAEQHFSRIVKASRTQPVDPWFSSAGAFWAARAAGKQGDHQKRYHYLQHAALNPTTFYGLLAHSALGYKLQPAKGVVMHQSTVSASSAARILAAYPAGERALALLDLDRVQDAEAELLQLHAQYQDDAAARKNIERALQWVVTQYDVQDIKSALAQRHGVNPVLQATYEDENAFPVMQEAVASSKHIDPALIHALIRQESRFNPNARNRSTGAAGLMQLMPRTANFMGDDKIDADALLNPAVNLQLGQRYVDYLLRQSHINHNLMYMAAAYNAGPGNLMAWQRKFDKERHDPLLFVESIPFSQTRAFVERVMTNYWIYSLRMGKDVSSLKALVDGEWPHHPRKDDKFNVAAAY
jgi:soluble lytic murein transglycosylase